jgi:hypothetical protein
MRWAAHSNEFQVAWELRRGITASGPDKAASFGLHPLACLQQRKPH